MSMATSWRLTAGQRLQHRHWDGEYVLYNDLSGDTHLLGADALTLLLTLEAGPFDSHALQAVLTATGLDGTSPADTDSLLEELVQLALVEPA